MASLAALAILFFIAAVALQSQWIKLMRRMALGDGIKSYGPSGHEAKIGTPGMGGVVALMLAPAVIISLLCIGAYSGWDALVIWAYPIGAAAVGLADDVLKKVHRSSEGLASLQKLFLQIAVSLPLALIALKDGVYLTPEIKIAPLLSVPILMFISVGLMNAVNVTDGLDGLAGGSIVISLIAFVMLSRDVACTSTAVIAIAIVMAFLWHNAPPASLFMGDVGAHLWAGLLLSLCVASRDLVLIFPLGSLFGIEIITVAIQIFSIRKLGRKVFLMSPIHHHFEIKGWKETKIVVRFWLIHVLGACVLIVILWLGGLVDV